MKTRRVYWFGNYVFLLMYYIYQFFDLFNLVKLKEVYFSNHYI